MIESQRGLVRRELMDQIDWTKRLICIKGFRGVGKTTFLIDIIREKFPQDKSCLYVNLNNFYFARRKIFNFVDEFYKKGGKVLIFDQIHKYPEWATELVECYNSFPELKIIFSASPVLRVTEGNDVLKKIAAVYHLEGLSFREFLNFKSGLNFKHHSLKEIIDNHENIAAEIVEKVRPLAFFSEYLEKGYYPYFLNNPVEYSEILLKNVNLALEFDVTYLNQIDMKYLPKLRRLMQFIGSHAPVSPNISKMSQDIDTSRATVLNYLRYLKNARLVNFLSSGKDVMSKKPDKIYIHNPNIMHVIDPTSVSNDKLIATFFFNQVGYQHLVKSSDIADFMIEGQYDFVVGGKYTVPKTKDSYAAVDMIEIGDGKTIPLWLFGFLY